MFARKDSDRYYRGFVTNVKGSQVSVRFDDGTTTRHPTSDAPAVILDETPTSNELGIGQSVIARGRANTAAANSFSTGKIKGHLKKIPNGCQKYKVEFRDKTEGSRSYYEIRISPA